MRDAGGTRMPTPMDESRKLKMEILRERVERDAYEIDPRKVAEAIVDKLLTARASDVPGRSSRQCS
jgi:Anti-sigma-28 factor, FlgM